MSSPWLFEFRRLAGLLVIGVVLGLITGQVLLFVLIGLALYLATHLRNIFRLERWLQGKGGHLPDSGGIWGEVHYRLYRLRKRNRKRKKRLATMLSRFRESTAAMPDATVVLNANNEIEWWNDAATRAFGLRYPQDTGQSVTNLVRHPDFHQFLKCGDFAGTMQLRAPINDQVVLSVRIVPYGNNQRLLVARDATRLHLLEQMRRDFIANVSHELRTPLTVIMGYVESLMDANDDCAKQWAKSLQAMQQQSSRMQHIVTDLLLLSRLETDAGEREEHELDVPALLEMIREDAIVLSQGWHTIRLEAEPGLWLRGDRGELRSAFSNLVYNAVHYTPEGGRIDIRWFSDDQGAHFEVEDTGVGVAAQHIPRLTERFYRVDVSRSRETGGTGLGLAIVKHVLMRHDSGLRIQSELGTGSVFGCDFSKDRILQKQPLKEGER